MAFQPNAFQNNTNFAIKGFQVTKVVVVPPFVNKAPLWMRRLELHMIREF